MPSYPSVCPSNPDLIAFVSHRDIYVLNTKFSSTETRLTFTQKPPESPQVFTFLHSYSNEDSTPENSLPGDYQVGTIGRLWCTVSVLGADAQHSSVLSTFLFPTAFSQIFEQFFFSERSSVLSTFLFPTAFSQIFEQFFFSERSSVLSTFLFPTAFSQIFEQFFFLNAVQYCPHSYFRQLLVKFSNNFFFLNAVQYCPHSYFRQLLVKFSNNFFFWTQFSIVHILISDSF